MIGLLSDPEQSLANNPRPLLDDNRGIANNHFTSNI